MNRLIIFIAVIFLFHAGMLMAQDALIAESDRNAQSQSTNSAINATSYFENEEEAFQSSDNSRQLEYMGSCFWNDLFDIVVEDGYAYCALTYGLIILDVSDGLPFDTLSMLFLPSRDGRAGDIDKNGDIIYISRYYEGVYVINVSDKIKPVILEQIPSRYRIRSIAHDNNRLFLAEEDSGLTIFDVTVPDHPKQLGVCTGLGQVINVCADGNIALVSAGSYLHIIDIENPSSPELLSSYEAFNIMNAVLDSNIAYVALYQNSHDILHILDLNNPSNPGLLGTYTVTDDSFDDDIVLLDSMVLFGSDIIDIRDIRAPRFIFQYRQYPGTGTCVYDNKIFVARVNWINVYDLSLLQNPPEIAHQLSVGSHYFGGNTVNVSGNNRISNNSLIFTLMETNRPRGIYCVDVSDINRPSIIGEVENQGLIELYAIKGNYLYAGMYIVDISDPKNMEIVGEFSGPFSKYDIIDVCISGHHAFVLVGFSHLGLYVYDIDNPQMPIFIYKYEVDESSLAFNDVAVKENMVFLATRRGLHIIDFSDPTMPELMAIYGNHSYGPITITDSIAYLASLDFEVVDISDPANPAFMGLYDPYPFLGSATEIEISGNYAYVPTTYRDLQVIDISNPFNPTLAETYRAPGEGIKSIYISGEKIYLADNYGLMVLNNKSNEYILCGDINSDGRVGISDAVCLINYIFLNGTSPRSIESAELNCDDQISITDIVYLINHIFLGGNIPCDINGDEIPDC